MRHQYDTRYTSVRPPFEVLAFRAGSRARPLHIHVRRWASNGRIASLLVYSPTLGEWFEGNEMPADVRAFALHALADRLGQAPTFACASGVRP